jgi:Fur family ferric uptake transcriptional regulator
MAKGGLSAKQIFDRYVAEKVLRSTPQRDRIVKVFLATERHVTVQELYDLVRKKDEAIGYATVARCVKLMEEAGICRKVDFGDGSLRYEHKYGHTHHDHIICLKCGRFVEIFSRRLEKLQDELVKKHGFSQEYHKLDIFGYCPKCQGRKR